MTDRIITDRLDCQIESTNALRPLSAILTEVLYHENTGCLSRDVCDGVARLFDHELDRIDEASYGLREELSARQAHPYNGAAKAAERGKARSPSLGDLMVATAVPEAAMVADPKATETRPNPGLIIAQETGVPVEDVWKVITNLCSSPGRWAIDRGPPDFHSEFGETVAAANAGGLRDA